MCFEHGSTIFVLAKHNYKNASLFYNLRVDLILDELQETTLKRI